MSTTPHRNGCWNRAPFSTRIEMQDGYRDCYDLGGRTRVPNLVQVPHRMAKDCRYTHTALGQADKGCTGCMHRKDFSTKGATTA